MDIQKNINETDQTFTELINLLSQISSEKFNQVPFEDSWTVGQLAQHIVLSADGFLQLLNGPVKDTDRDPEQNVGNLKALFLNFDIKFKSPDFIVPEEKDYNKQEIIDTLKGIKTGLLKAIEILDPTLTCVSFELPGSGYVTRAEATTFVIVHTQRHIHQLKNMIKNL